MTMAVSSPYRKKSGQATDGSNELSSLRGEGGKLASRQVNLRELSSIPTAQRTLHDAWISPNGNVTDCVFATAAAPEGKVARFMEIVAVAQWSVAAMQPLLRAFAVCSLAYMKGAFGASQRVIEVLRELNAP